MKFPVVSQDCDLLVDNDNWSTRQFLELPISGDHKHDVYNVASV